MDALEQNRGTLSDLFSVSTRSDRARAFGGFTFLCAVQALARDELIDLRYRIVRRIGQGAWATVYEGVDTHLDRRIAIKILNYDLVDNPTLKKRFVHEAEAAIRIDSPFVVAVHAVGTIEQSAGKTRPYIVMELLEGEDLGRHLERVGCLGEERAVEFAIHAASGLAHAHARGVLHRDIKPENLFIVRADGDELLKIVDLGISKLLTSDAESPSLTRTNVVLGSPAYMSPEQCRGARHMDHRSDVYSLGVVLYECLTGTVPHDGDNVNHLMFKIALEDVPDPRSIKPHLDPRLAAIVLRALERNVDDRIASASELRELLLEWGARRGARVPPTPPSKTRVRAPTKITSRHFAVTMDELDDDDDDDDDDADIATLTTEKPAVLSYPSSLRPTCELPIREPETTTTGGTAADLHAATADLELAAPSTLRRRLPVIVAIAAGASAAALAIAIYPWGSNAPPSSIGANGPPPQPSTPPQPSATEPPPPPPSPPAAPTPTVSESARPAKPAPKKPAPRPKPSADPNGETESEDDYVEEPEPESQ
jgi:serine/threonine-protein kinase